MTDAAKPSHKIRDPRWEERVRATFHKMPIIETFGMAIDALSPGVCVLSMPFKPELTQQNGFFQAGVVAALADNAGGIAAATLMAPGSDVLAVEFKINLMAPAKGERMLARAEVIKSGRTLTISTITVSVEDDGKVSDCALMQQTCIAIGG